MREYWGEWYGSTASHHQSSRVGHAARRGLWQLTFSSTYQASSQLYFSSVPSPPGPTHQRCSPPFLIQCLPHLSRPFPPLPSHYPLGDVYEVNSMSKLYAPPYALGQAFNSLRDSTRLTATLLVPLNFQPSHEHLSAPLLPSSPPQTMAA